MSHERPPFDIRKDINMSIITMVKNIKEVHKEDLAMYKVGNFYNAYGKDAYIISYLFGYNIKPGKDNLAVCGFPKVTLPKVMSILENKKINYITLDVRNNYDVDDKQDNKNLNTYNNYVEKASKYVKLKRRIDEIYNTLLEGIEKEEIIHKIRNIEEIVYEN